MLAMHFTHEKEEGQAADNHEKCGFHEDQIIELAHGKIRGGKATGGDARKTMVEGIEERHARKPVGNHRNDRKRQINHQQATAECFHPWQSLVGPFRRLGGEQPHAADPQKREYRNEHTDNSDTTNPLQNGPPDQKIPVHIIEAAEHRCPGGGNPRGALEKGVCGRNAQVTQIERKR